MPFKERKIILSNIRFVDEVIAFEDDEAGSCKNALEKLSWIILMTKYFL